MVASSNAGKIVNIKTEYAYHLKVLFDVLKEVLHEVKLDFIKNTTESGKANEESSDSSDDDDSYHKKKKPVPKKDAKKQESSDSSDDDDYKKPKSAKKNSSSSESTSSDSDSDDMPKKKVLKKKATSSDSEENVKKKVQEKKPSGGGIRIMAVDNYQTILIYVKLESEQFKKFYVKPNQYSVGIDLVQLHKFIKTVDKESFMRIYIEKGDEQNIGFQLHNYADNSSTDYKQKLLDIDDNTKKLPQETNFEMTTAMHTAKFKKICGEMNGFSEYVEIECTAKEITFRCQGDSNRYVQTFKHSEEGVRISCLQNNNNKGLMMVQGIFNLKHLISLGKCTNLCNEMQLYLKNDYPIFLHYTIGLLGKMLVGLSPIDEKTIKRENDYDEAADQYYTNKKPVTKTL